LSAIIFRNLSATKYCSSVIGLGVFLQLALTVGSLAMCWFRKHKTACYHKYILNAPQVMASANKKFTPLKKCACNLHEPQHIARVLLGVRAFFILALLDFL
jgi:hypothetical protein